MVSTQTKETEDGRTYFVKMTKQWLFRLSLFIWAWIFFASGEVWRYLEGGLLAGLKKSQTPQAAAFMAAATAALRQRTE